MYNIKTVLHTFELYLLSDYSNMFFRNVWVEYRWIGNYNAQMLSTKIYSCYVITLYNGNKDSRLVKYSKLLNGTIYINKFQFFPFFADIMFNKK